MGFKHNILCDTHQQEENIRQEKQAGETFRGIPLQKRFLACSSVCVSNITCLPLQLSKVTLGFLYIKKVKHVQVNKTPHKLISQEAMQITTWLGLF